MADNTDHNSGTESSPSERLPTTGREWLSQDLIGLQSGRFADAEIICEGNVSRKVHRIILASRSAWFRKAFSNDDTEEGVCQVHLQETAWRVDLILYFFYVGRIDMADETLTGGRGFMEISIELLRFGNTLWSKNMHDYGKDLLVIHLGKLLDYICDTNATDKEKDVRFNHAEFTEAFYPAVRNAFDTERPVVFAQRTLADFAFAARMHLFNNTAFVSFIRTQQVPEFGNMVLASLMVGNVSDAFQDNSTFKKWQDWKSMPPSPPSDQSEIANGWVTRGPDRTFKFGSSVCSSGGSGLSD